MNSFAHLLLKYLIKLYRIKVVWLIYNLVTLAVFIDNYHRQEKKDSRVFQPQLLFENQLPPYDLKRGDNKNEKWKKITKQSAVAVETMLWRHAWIHYLY